MHADLLRRTREVIAGCECEHGCPTCVGPVGNTGPLAKLVALRILDRLARMSLPQPASPPALDPPVPGITTVLDPPSAHSLAELPPF